MRLAQIGIGVLLLVIIRALGEFFRLKYLQGEALVIEQVAPFIAGALFATIALALTIICTFANLYRTSMAVTVAALILLFVYKVAVMG
jgi:hypothetical protein